MHNPTRNALVYVTDNPDSAGNYIIATFNLNNDLYGENAHKAHPLMDMKTLQRYLKILGETHYLREKCKQAQPDAARQPDIKDSGAAGKG